MIGRFGSGNTSFPFRCRDKEHQGICAAGTGRSSAFDCCGKGTEQIGVQMPLQ